MIDLLIGYAVAIAIVFIASRPLSIYRPRRDAEKFGGAHGRGVGNFVRTGTRGLRVAPRANCPVCSVSCSKPPTVTKIRPSLHVFIERVVARLQLQRGFTDVDLDDAVRAALTGLIQSAA